MKLDKNIRTGDWILVSGTSTISKLIKKATIGKVNHAAMVYDDRQVFETDGSWGKAEFHPLAKFEDKKIIVIRPRFLTDFNKVQDLCKLYEGTPYSYWDIVMNGLTGWLKDELRERLLSVTGNKKFMICSELVARITYETTQYKNLTYFEGLTPQDLLDLALRNYHDFDVVLDLL